MKKKNKILYLEMLRIFACFFVIFNHTGIRGFFLFTTQEPGSITFWLYLIISIFCEMSVPLFFMISGAILLRQENYSTKKLIFKILKTFIILILFSAIYYFVDVVYLKKPIPINIKTFFRELLESKIHLWFLFSYLKYLCWVPLLRILVKNLKDKHFYYILVLNIISQGFFVIFEYLFYPGEKVINDSIRYLMTEITFVCPCIGYFVKNRVDTKNIKFITKILWLASSLAIFITAIMVNHHIETIGIVNFNENNGQIFNECFTTVIAATVFATFKCFFEQKKLPLFFEKFFVKLGECIFGIYLIHGLTMYVIVFLRIDSFLGNSMFDSLIYCLLVFSISAVVVASFKLIIFLLKNLFNKLIKNKIKLKSYNPN